MQLRSYTRAQVRILYFASVEIGGTRASYGRRSSHDCGSQTAAWCRASLTTVMHHKTQRPVRLSSRPEPRGGAGMESARRTSIELLTVPEPNAPLAAPRRPAVRRDSSRLGRSAWIRPCQLQKTIDATDEGTLIYRRTRNLRAVQLRLGKLQARVDCQNLSIQLDDSLEISEQTEI